MDLLPVASKLERIQSFIEGNAATGLRPLDLASAGGMEIVLVADSIQAGILYVIDGNHRLIAHWLQGRELEGIPVLLAVHERIGSWAYIPDYLRKPELGDKPEIRR